MAYTHIAHDCVIGDHVIMANAATLGGHVTVEDWAHGGRAVPGAPVCAHRHARLRRRWDDDHARCAALFEDLGRARHACLWIESVGLERRGFSKERIRKIHHAYKVLLASKLNTSQALEKLKAEPDRGEDVEMLIRFIEGSERGVIK